MMCKYTISKHKSLGKYVVWKETKTEYGYGCIGVFQGTKQQCEEKLKEVKNG